MTMHQLIDYRRARVWGLPAYLAFKMATGRTLSTRPAWPGGNQ